MIGKRARIVLADVEESSRKALGGILFERGYAVALAKSDDEALRLVAEESTDILFAGLRIARMDGHGLLARMQSGFPEVAVVVTTTPGEIRSALQSLRDGADAFVIEPLEIDELNSLFERILRKHRGTHRPLSQRAGSGVTVPGSSLEDIEREAILKTLEACGGSTSRAAGMLKISSRTIQYKLKQYRAEAGITSRGLGEFERG